MRRWVQSFFVLLMAGAVVACGGDGGTPTTAELEQRIFQQSCIFSGCHNATDRSGDLSLAAGAAQSELVGVVPNDPEAAADGLLRVDPGNPDNSFILLKLTLANATDPRYGDRMPQGSPPLSAGKINDIRAWIEAGAPAN